MIVISKTIDYPLSNFLGAIVPIESHRIGIAAQSRSEKAIAPLAQQHSQCLPNAQHSV
jgi:hypothetical protein